MRAELKRAADLVAFQRREALSRKRLSGDPRNPFRPRYGAELTFAAASQEAETLGYILKLLEKEAARECARRVFPTLDAILDFVVGLGLMALGGLGLAAEIGTSPQYLSYILYGVRSGEKYLPAIIAALNLDPPGRSRR